ncbi:hypothetical protein HGQ17_06700 [Nesterenkonia sp. MY13]|uniref:YokE-like PH domain-containing protein n=1 Tax=Nesterenkonia sedimenti TaxID=1463632 RepID=A0A7X8YDI1_9MICC|nr:SHOCT domain-containing protein [Nesterenkonia sedimenti]NLS09698.1 hypothetical protein [Nesterenkonia sedimenti]
MSHKQQIAEARQRMASKFWTGGSIKALPKVLQSQEAVLEMASASFNDGQGIAVLTTHRVFGLRAGLTGRELEERPAETITAVHSKRGLINSSLTIESLTGSLTFSSMVAEDATRLETRIRTALAWQGPPEPYAPGNDFDPYGSLPTGSSMPHPEAAERLRSLRELYDQGLLMESEYQAKRAEIIAQL